MFWNLLSHELETIISNFFAFIDTLDILLSLEKSADKDNN